MKLPLSISVLPVMLSCRGFFSGLLMLLLLLLPLLLLLTASSSLPAAVCVGGVDLGGVCPWRTGWLLARDAVAAVPCVCPEVGTGCFRRGSGWWVACWQ